MISALLYVAAVFVTLLIAPHAPVYWDSFGYVRQALAGDVGGLGLGRPVFALVSHAVASAWIDVGGSPWLAEPVLRAWWTTVSCASAPLTWRLARASGLDKRTSWMAGLAVACSPAMAHAGGAVLTDGPAVTCFVAGCLAAVRAIGARDTPAAAWLGAASGCLVGIAIGIREQSLLGIAALVLLWRLAPSERRRLLAWSMTVGLVVAVGAPMLFVLATQPGYADTIRTWLDGMRHDRARKTYGPRDLLLMMGWLLSLGPVVVVAAIAAYSRFRAFRSVSTIPGALALASSIQIVAAMFFLGITYSPRFFLTPFPMALAIPGAAMFDVWIGRSPMRAGLVVAALVLPVMIATPLLRADGRVIEATIRDWPSVLLRLPPDSVIVSGQPCPAVSLVRETIARDPRGVPDLPDWEPICPGWAWPSDLDERLRAAITAGRPVVLDLRPGSWVGAEQQAALRQAAAFADRHAAEIAAGHVIVLH